MVSFTKSQIHDGIVLSRFNILVIRPVTREMGGTVYEPGAMENVDISKADAAEKGENGSFSPEIVGHKSGNETPDEDDQGNVEGSLKANYRVC